MQCTDGKLWCLCRLMNCTSPRYESYSLLPMSRVHSHKRITFLVTFSNISLWESSRNGIQQQQYLRKQRERLHGTTCPHLCSQQRSTKPGTSTVRTKPLMITWAVAVISLWLSSWKLINRVSEARWSVCLPPASHLKNDKTESNRCFTIILLWQTLWLEIKR